MISMSDKLHSADILGSMPDIKVLVSSMTLEEKAGLTSGLDAWLTKAVERLGIPSVRMSDGPHGLRTEINGNTLKAVCFPTASMTASSFDRELLYEIGRELGRESREKGVNILLGPGINIKRSPLCGRNFEYFSEDPYLTGELGAEFVSGVQSEGVGTSLKHFFANSQEHRRMDSTSEMDDRTMREIYLAAFETVVKKSQPWTIMASYNRLGGIYSTANKKYITELLRDEWGFEGVVVSDWGATHDRAAAIEAGTDITMPAENTDGELCEAVRSGRLSESALDACCERILELVFKCVNAFKEEKTDYERGHQLAVKAARESIVLLKNDGVLPLSKDKRVLFVGGFAENPRFQGGGSSHVNAVKVISALEGARALGAAVDYLPGYKEQGFEANSCLHDEAVKAAGGYDAVVIFAGLPDRMETEGADRRIMSMPQAHNRLIEDICRENPNTIVVLHNGSPVEIPWHEGPSAILEAYLSGEGGGEAVSQTLYGLNCPSGHLSESFPVKLSDNPSYLYYFGEGDRVEYREGVFVGYRYYTTKELKTLYPFGHGLSYTSFEYSGLTVDSVSISEDEELKASVRVKNTGGMTGKAVVQLYVAPPRREVIRPVRELKGFEKVELAPGEEKTVSFTLSRRAFAHWESGFSDWRVEGGEYRIEICENAESVILSCPVEVRQLYPLRPASLNHGTSIGDFSDFEKGRRYVDKYLGRMLMGMRSVNFIPGEMVGVMEKCENLEKLDLDGLKKLAATIPGGMDAYWAARGMPVSTIAAFSGEEAKAELRAILEES